MSDMNALADWLTRIEQQLDDSQKRRLTRQLATRLRQNMVKRIRAQRDPSGNAFVPRKRDHIRAIRRGALFQRLPRMIKTAYSSTHAEVGFAGRTATVMAVHQYGLTARPSPTSRAVAYPIRQTVGFGQDDEQIIITTIKDFLLTG